jgi:hypothetical protein
MSLLVAAAALLFAPAQNIPADALARRDRSNAQLRAEGVPVNASLPVIEAEHEARRVLGDVVAIRALALLAVSMRGGGVEEKEVRAFIRDFALDGSFTPAETAFLATAKPSEQDMAQFSWRNEAACVLLWAVGKIASLGRPEKDCSFDEVQKAIQVDRKTYLATAKLRPLPQILDEADRIYRYRWALVDQTVGGTAVPAWLNGDIAMERHHALNWLVQSPATPWDDISLDT